MIRALESIDMSLPLRERMIAAVEVTQVRLRRVFRLFIAMRLVRPPQWKGDPDEEVRRKEDEARTAAAFLALLGPDAAQLRYSPEEVSHRMRLITFSATHPMISDGRPLTAEEIVDFALDGVRIHNSGDC